VEVDASAPIADVLARLDIGVSAHVVGPRHTYDIAEGELRRLLSSVATHAAARKQHAYLQVPGRCLGLDRQTLTRCAETIGGSLPRFRLLITGRDGRTIENIAVELWTESARALRTRSDEPAIRLVLPGRVRPSGEPHQTDSSVTFPIDVVYTWVDATDEDWRRLAAEHMDLRAIDTDRYSQSGELRYSLRSLDVFAPWVRYVYVLSNCAPPDWFRESERFTWVDHDEVMDSEQRPQFNSGAIDTFLHRIPGLSEQFVYLNDDFMLWDSALPLTFFTWDGRSIAHLAVASSVLLLQQMVDEGSATPQQHSRINAARLLEERVGVYPTRLHGHVPYSLRRPVLEQIEAEFPAEMASTRASRVRGMGDVSFVALLYHYYADAKGKGLLRDAPHSFVKRNNYQRERMRESLRRVPFICIQDSHGSAEDPEYQAFKRETLERALPLPSSAERDGGLPAGAS
jgi:hypothetical protein